jgi:probable phosphoglycerate mutase
MRIYLIRHGETIYNAARILQFPDTPLSERGQAQARALGERLRGSGVKAILTSDYDRAHRTAHAVHDTTGAPMHMLESLRERNLGDLRGSAFAELQVDPFDADYHPPGGESWDQFHRRVERAWGEIQTFAGGARGDFAVVSHALVCRALVDRCVPVADSLQPESVRFGNTSVTEIHGPPWEVTLLGCTAHLPEDQITYPNHPPGR